MRRPNMLTPVEKQSHDAARAEVIRLEKITFPDEDIYQTFLNLPKDKQEIWMKDYSPQERYNSWWSINAYLDTM